MPTASVPRYLTKSRFKLAAECPTKLFYTGKRDVYADTSLDDDFLKALAEGGFQVGELAKLMYPGGIEVTASSHAEQLEHTRELLSRKNVTIYEAAICHANLFARVDILQKCGDSIDLIEVKAKSYDPRDERFFENMSGNIQRKMLPYLQDIAFQRYVFDLAFPGLKESVKTYLMMADKTASCTVPGLNQKFMINRVDGRSRVQVSSGTNCTTIGAAILTAIPVDRYVAKILRGNLKAPGIDRQFATAVRLLSDSYRDDRKHVPAIGGHCAKCEFRQTGNNKAEKSGFHECWMARGLTEQEIDGGTILDLWNFRDKDKLIHVDKLKLTDIDIDDVKPKQGQDGLSRSQRQWMQVTGVWAGGGDFYLDRKLMSEEMKKWTFPLHFIDFETARVAVPFHMNQSPYANVAFQFSHHMMHQDGRVQHSSQWLNSTPGISPNYDFVRQLKMDLGEAGTIFMWSPHETRTLKAIRAELEKDDTAPEDADDLKTFIGTLVEGGGREIVDLLALAERAFFHPATKGGSSLKKILPAVMAASDFLKKRYSQPIYGAVGGIPSLNFKDWSWWREQAGQVMNPYRLLPPVFNDLSPEVQEKLDSVEDMQVAQGGAAATAYVRLQFEELFRWERESIEEALRRYCELDTQAMVMIYEAWREWL